MIYVEIAALVVGFVGLPFYGFFVLAPVLSGYKAFTTPGQAARGERRR